MASGGKKKTTMAKLNRESKLRERRLDKQARKDARKQAAALGPDDTGDALAFETGEPPEAGSGEPTADVGVPALADG